MTPAIYALIFLALGIALMAIEVTLIPGFGLVGILGLLSMFYGGWLAWTEYGPVAGVGAVMGGLLIAGVMTWMFLRSGYSKRMVLRTELGGEPSSLPATGEELVGATGVAESDLRPAGFARIDGRRRDVVADDGAYIEAGRPVVVVRIAQNSIVVREGESG